MYDPRSVVVDPNDLNRINVASNCMLKGPVDAHWMIFEAAGFPDEALPDDKGWMPASATSGYFLGRYAIGEALVAHVAELAGRGSYSKMSKSRFMREVNVLDHCEWPFPDVPIIATPSLQALAVQVFEACPRRKESSADQSSRHAFLVHGH